MRIVVHDYVGHPFQVDLSRELARRGHEVTHLYCASVTTPRGALELRRSDPSSLQIEGVELTARVDRERLFRRRRLEAEHGSKVASRLAAIAPDVVLSANAPLDAQKRIAHHCRTNDVRFVFWVQDLIGEALERLLRPRLGPGVVAVVRYYRALEQRLLREADAVVVISEDFLPFIRRDATVIENWAPVGELQPEPKCNAWSRAQGLATTTNVMYAGTLGMKHDPGTLLAIAEDIEPSATTRLVVASEGTAVDWLRARATERGLSNIVLLPFQPFEQLSSMLGSADVLLALLEPDAGVFSVPSKVLTQLCTGKPQLLVVPSANLAARIVEREGAGLVVPPGDRSAVSEALRQLLGSSRDRESMGHRALEYARRAFDITAIADRFEVVLAPPQSPVDDWREAPLFG